MNTRHAFLLILIAAILTAAGLQAQVPRLISYQGVLTESDGSPLNGAFDLVFSLYPDSNQGTAADWTESHQDVDVAGGLFQVILGGTSTIDDVLIASTELWVGISVDGAADLYPRLRLTSVPYALRAAVADSVSGGSSSGDSDWTVSGNDQYSAVPGNVGIGTSSPAFKLDVVGEGRFDGALRARDGTGIGLQNSSGETGVWVGSDGNVGIKNPAYFYQFSPMTPGWGPDLHVNTGTDTATVYIGGTLAEAWSEPGQLIFTGYDRDSFNTYPGRIAGIAAVLRAAGTSMNGAKGELVFKTNDGHGLGLIGGDPEYYERMRIDYQGRVGIGVSSPVELLDVDGALRLGNTSNSNLGTLRWSGTDFQGYTGSGWTSLTAGAGGSDGDWTIAGNNMYANPSGNVGIGVTDPTSKLTVSDRIELVGPTYSTYLIENGGALAIHSDYPNVYAMFRLLPYGNDIWFQNTIAHGHMYFAGPAGADLTGNVLFKTTGKVGIGTTNPTAKLHIGGVAGTDGIRFPDGTLQTTAYTGGSGSIGGSGTANFLSKFTAGQTIGNSQIYDTGTRIGLGTTAPANRLDVEGSLAVGSTYSGTNAAPANGMIVQGQVSIGTVASANMLDIEGAVAIGAAYAGTSAAPADGLIVQGNVGVGTSNPTHRLDVVGEVGIEDYLRHNDDVDTYLRFLTNETQLNAGGIQLLRLFGGTQNTVTINETGVDVDFRIESDTDPQALMVRGDTGRVGVGTQNPVTKLDVVGTITGDGLTIAGGGSFTGDLDVDGTTSTGILEITGGSDLAEPFEMTDHAAEIPGTVVVIDERNPGKLRVSETPYDRKVAGIVSGAGGVNPGLTLRQEGVLGEGRHVALTGRVWCRADAAYGAIRPGDRLTTSATAGHAMRVDDETRAPGAVIGKAMSVLDEGRGLVLVLVQAQ